MDKLWAPWRVEYIRNPGTGCFFCEGLRSRDDRKVYIVERGMRSFTIMNRFPYNNGHVMIAPVRHVGQILDLDDEEIIAVHHLMTRVIRAIDYSMKPQGYNIGVNQGRVSGAGVIDHVHFHVVPRWQGDTNFMPIVSETKVISEALMKTYEKIKEGLDRLDNLEI
ncbi:MAG: HIT domain-containing protein [candidate division WOR-3 bacterium]|nr:MAG: HIT domain-containing protein [candidate division WOR-3 bacterium]